MMGRICLGLSLPLLLGAAQNDLPDNWKPVVSTTGGFKVTMPPKPTEKKQQVKTATGQLNVFLLLADGRNDSVFVVSYCDYPDADSKKGTEQKRLDHARDGAVSSARGKLLKEEAIKLKGHPGREIVIEKNGETVARMRIFLVNRRLYQVMALGNAAPKEAGFFLASFDLNE